VLGDGCSREEALAASERAMGLLSRMERHGVRPNTTSYNRAMLTSQRAEQWGRTSELFGRLERSQWPYTPNQDRTERLL